MVSGKRKGMNRGDVSFGCFTLVPELSLSSRRDRTILAPENTLKSLITPSRGARLRGLWVGLLLGVIE